MRKPSTVLLALVLAGSSLVGTQAASADPRSPSRDVTGLAGGGTQLVFFDATDVGTITRTTTVTGIPAGQTLVGIDYRPNGGGLYGVTQQSGALRLYTIDAAGVASAVSTDPFATVAGDVSIDFNPTVDRLRVVSSEGDNFRVNPATAGPATRDGRLSYQPVGSARRADAKGIAGVAYINNDNDCIVAPTATPPVACPSPATGTTLYDLDSTLDRLAVQSPPNDGTLVPVGPADQDLSSGGTGFDVYSPSANVNEAYASLSKNGKSRFFSVDLATGALQPLGKIAADVVDIALPPVQ